MRQAGPGEHGAEAGGRDALLREIEALRARVRELEVFEQLALRDPLTGLANRRAFDERLAAEQERARRDRAYTFAVLVVDLDAFKAVNDTLGHAAGDEVLRAAARFLTSRTRPYDVVCRLGGDELAVILPGLGGDAALAVAERVRRAAREARRDGSLAVGLSLGVASWADGHASAAAVVEAADAAMYAEKRARKAARACAPAVSGHPAAAAAGACASLPLAEPPGACQPLRRTGRPAPRARAVPRGAPPRRPLLRRGVPRARPPTRAPTPARGARLPGLPGVAAPPRRPSPQPAAGPRDLPADPGR